MVSISKRLPNLTWFWPLLSTKHWDLIEHLLWLQGLTHEQQSFVKSLLFHLNTQFCLIHQHVSIILLLSVGIQRSFCNLTIIFTNLDNSVWTTDFTTPLSAPFSRLFTTMLNSTDLHTSSCTTLPVTPMHWKRWQLIPTFSFLFFHWVSICLKVVTFNSRPLSLLRTFDESSCPNAFWKSKFIDPACVGQVWSLGSSKDSHRFPRHNFPP